jgi:ubiquinone/menaquinone biosynthesis C-methylase UbiE
LASVFDRVIATDGSQRQIANAQAHDRVEYRVATAEESVLESATVDLVAVTQALHWFDLDRFYPEATRVLKPNGIIAAAAYLFAQITPAIDTVVSRYYYEVVGAFWAPERKLVENFARILFPFQKISTQQFKMKAQWNLEDLVGYLKTWSASRPFMKTTGGDPVDLIIKQLRTAWGDATHIRTVTWPLNLHDGIKRRAKTLE